MRLLTVTHFFESHGGGIERVAGHLNRHFTGLGHETSWVASDEDALPPSGTARAIGIRCANFVERLSGLPMPIPSLRGLGRLRDAVAQCDAVVIHDALYVTSIAAMILARRAGKPTILIQHIASIPFSNPVLRLAMHIANRMVTAPMLRAAGQPVFISDTVRSAFAGIATKRPPLLLFNGVDTAIFTPGNRAVARKATGMEDGRRQLLFVGRFVEKKGMAVLRALAKSRPDLRFVLAGKGPIDPDAWGLENVHVERGRAGASLAELYRAADLFLLPSVGEGYPLVIQEAMACGLPVICGEDSARADPGAGSWLVGVNVRLAEPEATAASVSTAIDGAGLDTATRDAMALYAARTYSWTGMAAALAGAIAEMVQVPSGTIVHPARTAAA